MAGLEEGNIMLTHVVLLQPKAETTPEQIKQVLNLYLYPMMVWYNQREYV
jgi:hypothetical protein